MERQDQNSGITPWSIWTTAPLIGIIMIRISCFKVTTGLKELMDLVKARLKGKEEEYTVTQYPFPCYRIPFRRMQRKDSWMVNEHKM